jgi:hypothetical protein
MKHSGNGIARAIAAALEAHEEESYRRRSQCVKAGKARLRQAGRHEGGRRRFGYRLVPAPDGGAPIEVPDPAEQKAILEVLELRRRGVSLMAVRDLMRGRGFPISHELVARLERRAAGKPPRPSSSKTRQKPRGRRVAASLPDPVSLPAVDPNGALQAAAAVPARSVEDDARIRQELAEIKALVKGQRQQDRNEHESGPAILRRLVSIERKLELVEPLAMPKPTRRNPMGA